MYEEVHMTCPYLKNSFCSLLTPELRKKLCAACTRINFPAGNILNSQTWNDAFSVLVDGFVISTDSEAAEQHSFNFRPWPR